MKISLTVIDFLILSLALQGLVLAGMLFYSSKKISSNRWLAAFVLLLSWCTISMEVFNSDLPNTNPLLYVFMPQLRLALGPLLYFYIRSLVLGDKKLGTRDYLHFFAPVFEMGPQVAFIFHSSGLLLIPGVANWYLPFEKQAMLFESGNSAGLPFFFSFIIYSFLCYKIVNTGQLNRQVSAYKFKDLRWLKVLLQVIFSLVVVWSIATLLSFLHLPQLAAWIRYTMPLLAITFVYWLGMSAYIRHGKMQEADVVEYNKPVVKKLFSDADADKYNQQLIALMETGNLYLNPALKVDTLAFALGLPEKHLSGLLNQYIGKSFNDFVNEYRIREAQKKLTDPALRQFTIAAIAFDCGFNSLATFQRSFKQFTGITPSQYQSSLNSGAFQPNVTQIPI